MQNIQYRSANVPGAANLRTPWRYAIIVGKHYIPNGQRECERRMRQIERGIIQQTGKIAVKGWK